MPWVLLGFLYGQFSPGRGHVTLLSLSPLLEWLMIAIQVYSREATHTNQGRGPTPCEREVVTGGMEGSCSLWLFPT